MQPTEILLLTNTGQDDYAPEIASGAESGSQLALTNAQNISVRKLSLVSPNGLVRVLDEDESLSGARNFASYIQEDDRSLWLYVLASSPRRVIFRGEEVATVALSNSLASYSAAEPFSVSEYINRVFITSSITNVGKITGATIVPVDFKSFGNVTARYSIIADDHLVVANLIQNGVPRTTRLIWSDIYNPEDFTLSESSEAGSFDVDFSNFQITGLSYQRGYLIIYTQNAVWRARYIGIDAGTYEFETLYSGIGNQYHMSVVTVKEMDVFVGTDSFYMLDGTQLHRIGDPIWSFFRATRQPLTTSNFMRGYTDEPNNEVFWTYVANGQRGTENNELWQVVYNYRDEAWSNRKAFGVQDVFINEYALEAGATWFDIPGDWDEQGDKTWAEYSEPINISSLQLTPTSIYGTSDSYSGTADENRACLLETHDLMFGSFLTEKEIYLVKPIYEGSGITSPEAVAAGHDLQIQYGVRNRYSEAVEWSAFESITDPDEDEFQLRSMPAGKFIKFRIRWTNTSDYHISRFIGVSLEVQTPINAQEKR